MAKTLELTISSDYVRNWGIWEAVRELMQNALDARDRGYEMTIKYTKENQRLRIISRGVEIGRDALILGNTTKRGDAAQRGNFGEGFKLAWMVLLRAGLKIWAKSGGERWTPRLEYSEKFKSELIKVEVADVKYERIVRCDIIGLGEGEWEMIQDRLLDLRKPESMIEFGGNKLLLEEKYRGKLYVKGIYVGKLPGEYLYGYDLRDVSLDRDRTLADPWSLRWETRNFLQVLVKQNRLGADDFFDLLSQDSCEEARVFNDYSSKEGGGIFENKIAALFREKYGENAQPVASLEEALQAQHFGIKGIVVSRTLANVVGHVTGSFEENKNNLAARPKEIYSPESFEKCELDNFLWVMDTFRKSDEKLDSRCVNVVDFYSDQIMGTYEADTDSVNLRKSILKDRGELVSTLVHEVAHRYGPDGSVAHRDAIDRIFGEIVVALSR